MSEPVPIDDGNCFACGTENPIGLHLKFERDVDADGVSAVIELASQFQGWRDIAHGGIVICLLDEAMAHAAAAAGHRGVTASMNVRFRKPVPLEVPVVVRGRIAWTRRTVLGVEARIFGSDGTLLVQADGHFVSKGSIDAVDDNRNPAN